MKTWIKSLFIGVLICLSGLLSAAPALAKSGCCSGHDGVNCAAGAQANGNVICNDGWRGSSCSYAGMVMCGGSSAADEVKSEPVIVAPVVPTPKPVLVPTPRPKVVIPTPKPTPTPSPSPSPSPTPSPSEQPTPSPTPTPSPSPAVLSETTSTPDESESPVVAEATPAAPTKWWQNVAQDMLKASLKSSLPFMPWWW